MGGLASAAVLFLLAVLGRDQGEGQRGWFADRPVAWNEHDDQPVTQTPERTSLQDWDLTLLVRDNLANEVDRVLAHEGGRPAEDVNALDEVPCSTWFCPRNHVHPMSPAAVAAGPPVPPPRPPLRIVKGKHGGATAGFEVVDANQRRFLLKLDPAGHAGMSTSPELIGQLLFHAAGYNVPGAFVLDLDPKTELQVDAKATFRLYDMQKRPLRPARPGLVPSGRRECPGTGACGAGALDHRGNSRRIRFHRTPPG